MIPGSATPAGRAAPFPFQAAWFLLPLVVLIFFSLVSVSGQTAALSPGAALASQSSAPDFARLLSEAVDKASGIEDAASILAAYSSYVKDGAVRRTLLLRHAALLELLGRWEEAAARYEDAAYAAPEPGDSASLLACARAYLAAGETEKALAILKVLGIASSDPIVRSRAGILEGWALLIEGRMANAKEIAERSVDGAPDTQTRLAALVLFWASSEGSSRTGAAARIRAAFPESPEAAMVETGDVPAAAHWLLTSAAGSGRPAASPKPGSAVSTAPASPPPAASPSKPAAASVSAAAASDSSGETAGAQSSRISSFQVGAFVQEANASALVRELGAKGFTVSVERRDLGGKNIWRVLVPAGTDSQATLLRLKDAGYESYPVF